MGGFFGTKGFPERGGFGGTPGNLGFVFGLGKGGIWFGFVNPPPGLGGPLSLTPLVGNFSLIGTDGGGVFAGKVDEFDSLFCEE